MTDRYVCDILKIDVKVKKLPKRFNNTGVNDMKKALLILVAFVFLSGCVSTRGENKAFQRALGALAVDTTVLLGHPSGPVSFIAHDLAKGK